MGNKKQIISVFFLAGMLLFPASLTANLLQASKVSCLAGKCHRELGSKRYLHGPIATGSCDVCHQVSNWPEKGHPQMLTRSDAEKCLFCHEESKGKMGRKNAHTPVGKGECVSCHDPHQSDHRFMLVSPSAGTYFKYSQLCFQCHDQDDSYWSTGFHMAVSMLDCTICHDPHSSPNRYQLTRYVMTIYVRDYLSLGREDMASGDYDSALKNLKLVLTVDPREVTALAMVAEAHLKLKEPDDTLRLADKLMEINPLDAGALFLKGLAYRDLGQIYQAMSQINQSLSLQPDNAEALFQLGSINLEQKLPQDALRNLLKATEIEPDRPDIHRLLAEAYEALGRLEEASKEKQLFEKLSGR